MARVVKVVVDASFLSETAPPRDPFDDRRIGTCDRPNKLGIACRARHFRLLFQNLVYLTNQFGPFAICLSLCLIPFTFFFFPLTLTILELSQMSCSENGNVYFLKCSMLLKLKLQQQSCDHALLLMELNIWRVF